MSESPTWLKVRITQREHDQIKERAQRGKFRSVAAYVRHTALYDSRHSVIFELQRLAVEVRQCGAPADEIIRIALQALESIKP